jgi:hypothetical protein
MARFSFSSARILPAVSISSEMIVVSSMFLPMLMEDWYLTTEK